MVKSTWKSILISLERYFPPSGHTWFSPLCCEDNFVGHYILCDPKKAHVMMRRKIAKRLRMVVVNARKRFILDILSFSQCTAMSECDYTRDYVRGKTPTVRTARTRCRCRADIFFEGTENVTKSVASSLADPENVRETTVILYSIHIRVGNFGFIYVPRYNAYFIIHGSNARRTRRNGRTGLGWFIGRVVVGAARRSSISRRSRA